MRGPQCPPAFPWTSMVPCSSPGLCCTRQAQTSDATWLRRRVQRGLETLPTPCCPLGALVSPKAAPCGDAPSTVRHQSLPRVLAVYRRDQRLDGDLTNTRRGESSETQHGEGKRSGDHTWSMWNVVCVLKDLTRMLRGRDDLLGKALAPRNERVMIHFLNAPYAGSSIVISRLFGTA